jgi:hypothetical protein
MAACGCATNCAQPSHRKPNGRKQTQAVNKFSNQEMGSLGCDMYIAAMHRICLLRRSWQRTSRMDLRDIGCTCCQVSMGSADARVVLDHDSSYSASSCSPDNPHPMATQAAFIHCSFARRLFGFSLCIRNHQAGREHDRESSPRETTRAIAPINTRGSQSTVAQRMMNAENPARRRSSLKS